VDKTLDITNQNMKALLILATEGLKWKYAPFPEQQPLFLNARITSANQDLLTGEALAKTGGSTSGHSPWPHATDSSREQLLHPHSHLFTTRASACEYPGTSRSVLQHSDASSTSCLLTCITAILEAHFFKVENHCAFPNF